MNEFKKKDHLGNKLNEEIGNGLNYCHLHKVLESKKENDKKEVIMSFRVTKLEFENFKKKCKDENFKPQDALRIFVQTF